MSASNAEPEVAETPTEVKSTGRPRRSTGKKKWAPLCYQFYYYRNCRRGDACTFYHPGPRTGPKPKATAPSTGEADDAETTSIQAKRVDGPQPITKRPPVCWKFKTFNACPKGDACPYLHKTRRTPQDSGASPAEPEVSDPIAEPQTETASVPNPATGSTPAAPSQGHIPSARREKKLRQSKRVAREERKSKDKVSREEKLREEVKENALLQSVAAKAEQARKVTIYSEDEKQMWTLSRTFLAKYSKTLGPVLSYTGKKADEGVRDPIKSLRGLVRHNDGSGSLQLDDIKTDDFDVFLDALRATGNYELSLNELKTILALASDWSFDDLCKRATRTIEKLHLSPLERITLARRCKITKWIRGAILGFAILLDSPDSSEMNLLGPTTAAAIWKARERIFNHRLDARSTKSSEEEEAVPRCHDEVCREVFRAVTLRLLEKPGFVKKKEEEMAETLGKDISAKEMEGLCQTCASDEGLKCAALAVAKELQLAKVAFEESFGTDDAQWLTPA